jgi:hypothetical protein
MADLAVKELWVGHVAGYDVTVVNDWITVRREGEEVTLQQAEGLVKFIRKAKDFKLGWGKFEDDLEVIYLYDKADGNFGYGVDLAISGVASGDVPIRLALAETAVITAEEARCVSGGGTHPPPEVV